MRSFMVFNRQSKYVGAAFMMLVATFAPLLVTTVASADELTSRSVQLSNSSKSATAVDYSFSFTATGTAGGVVVEFCSNTPLMLESCTAPTGFSTSLATAGGGAVLYGTRTANKVQLTKSITAGSNTFTLGNITNPSSAGSIYARIITYTADTDTDNYTTTAYGLGKQDNGAVAASITDTIGVSGSVLESMTFCVAKTAIDKGCNLSGNTAPTLELGETVGTVKALDAASVSTDSIFTQLSTNATSGAIVNLKTSNTCGGLMRVGAAACDIVPSSDGISAGQAEFGLKTAATSTDAPDASGPELSGTYQVKTGTGYNSSTYLLNYASNGSTGVTSTYGDPLLDTAGAPVNNRNMQITFAASISNATPAGRYNADLSMVATGTF